MAEIIETRSSRTVRIHLLDGTTSGLLSAEIGMRTPLILVAPSARFPELLRRKEMNRIGIYILSGVDQEHPEKQKIYIGKGDCVRERLRFQLSHFEDEDYQRLAVIVSSNESLTSSQNLFLESKLVELARQADEVTVQNGNNPKGPPLSDFERTEANEFLENTLTILPLLHFDFFRSILVQSPALSPESIGQPLFTLEGSGAVASARETDDGFVVLAGSTARIEQAPALQEHYRLLRDRFVKEGKLVPTDKAVLLRFTLDTIFSSPSAAASVVLARSASGPLEWKLRGSGQSYKDWRESLLRETVLA